MGKFDLDKLKVQSFVTSLDEKKRKTIKGGTMNTDIGLGCDDSGNPPCGFTDGLSCNNQDTCDIPEQCFSVVHGCVTEKTDPACMTAATTSGGCCG